MDTSTSEYWGVEAPRPLLAVAMAPLTAVVLSLMALWIAAIPPPTHAVAMEIDGCVRSAREPVVHTVAVDFDNVIWWDTQLVEGPAALDARMRAIAALPWDEQDEVHIRPSRAADYRSVVAVMASAQRNMVRKTAVIDQASFISDGICPPPIPIPLAYRVGEPPRLRSDAIKPSQAASTRSNTSSNPAAPP